MEGLKSRLRSSLSNLNRGTRLTGILVFAVALFGLGVAVGSGGLKVPGFYVQNSSQPRDLDPSPLWRIWNEINARFDGQAGEQEKLYGAMDGLVEGLGDPYSDFLTPDETKDFQAQLEGKIEGIGAEVGIRDGSLVIISPLTGSPAERAGLRAGDRIISIDGRPAEGLSVGEAVGKIRGAKGTQVKLGLSRGETLREVTITRDVIQAPSVSGRNERGFAYIRVSRFSEDTDEDFRAELARRLGERPAGLILDLRSNPGGYLQSAVTLASEFLPGDAVVVKERGRRAGEKSLRASGSGLLESGPLPIVVLIDGGSASASEIVAGALRDHDRARLIGQKSFGKGSVQDYQQLTGGASLRLTIAHWFTPDGHGIDKTGLKPDIEVAEDETGEATLERAVQYLQTGR
jgi:carboxyl-terminal processing protease